MAHVNALDPRPDVVLATGDLVEGGKPEEYARLKRLLAPLAMPVYLIPGNHDAREALRAAFADHAYLPASGFLQYASRTQPVRLIALDTLVPGKPHGALCAERLDWLEARLGESDRPTILFMHHPPFDCGIDAFDSMRPDRRATNGWPSSSAGMATSSAPSAAMSIGRSRCAGPAPWPRSRPARRTRRRSTCTTTRRCR